MNIIPRQLHESKSDRRKSTAQLSASVLDNLPVESSKIFDSLMSSFNATFDARIAAVADSVVKRSIANKEVSK
jgi:hypothetical protein